MTNGMGTDLSRADEFEAFDKLPKYYRDFLNNATIPLGIASIRATFWRYTLKEAFPMVKQAVAQLEVNYCIKVWGRDHPFIAERTAKKKA